MCYDGIIACQIKEKRKKEGEKYKEFEQEFAILL